MRAGSRYRSFFSVTSLAHVGSIVAGKYKLLQRLGGGGMGEVFRAEHQFAGREVALKLLRRDFATDPDLTRRFFQEAQAVTKSAIRTSWTCSTPASARRGRTSSWKFSRGAA